MAIQKMVFINLPLYSNLCQQKKTVKNVRSSLLYFNFVLNMEKKTKSKEFIGKEENQIVSNFLQKIRPCFATQIFHSV